MHYTKHIQIHKALALLLSLSLFLTAAFGGTLAYIVTQTPSLQNTFLSGLDPTGDLIIRKEVTHPFGSGYAIPDGLSFDFVVSLGSEYAGKRIETSQGDMTADDNGNFTVSVTPDEAVCIKNLKRGTSVTVTEDSANGFTPNGGAEQTVTIRPGDNNITYTNTYAPSPVGPVNLTVTGTKLLEGRDWQEGDSFTFLLEYKLAGADAEWQVLGETSVTYELIEVQDPEFPDDPEKTVWIEKPDYDKFSFTELVQSVTYSAAGEYSFRVSEVSGTIPGITYDKVVSYFDVLVGDADMDGSLEIQNVAGYQNATASYDASTGNYHVDVTVNNQYAPAGTAEAILQINKSVTSLSGENKSAAGYTFELYDENGNLVATSAETSSAGETFLELAYDAKDAGTTFHYTLKETHSGETYNGLTYDSTVYSISVSVVDNLDGTISAYVYDTADYKTELLTIEPEETEPTEGTETPTEGNNEPIDPAETAPNIHNETDIPVEPVTTSETKEIVVIPEGASNSYAVSFLNVYDPADTAASFGGIKELTGRGLNAGEFSFALYATGDSFTVAEAMEPVQTVSNDAEGNFDFAAISYSKVGTYRYVVKEDASDKLGGVTYDTSVFHVIVTVTDENGALKATTTITDELGAAADIKFENSYKAAATSVTFTGTKILTGADLTADMFRFYLYQADANYTVQSAALAGASNDASGSFTFESITCSEPGTFYYVVTEDASAGVEGMTYDDTAYGIKVNVWDDGTGSLKASFTITVVGGDTAEAIVFENSYTKPVEPPKPTDPTDSSDPTDPSEATDPSDPTKPTDPSKPTDPTKPSAPDDPDIPSTGDETQIGLYIALAAISIAAIILLLVAGKKKYKGRYARK